MTIRAAALLVCGFLPLQSAATLVLSSDTLTVYDTANAVTWLADGNLAASSRFGLPVCNPSVAQPCVNPSGSMSYQSAVAWVQAMNAANYLGHTNWQLPTSPFTDTTCPKTGPNGTSFGFGCTGNALGSLFYSGLSLKAPHTAVPIPTNTAGPFTNFQPYLYWSQSPGSGGNATLSFNSGFQGANTVDNFLYLLPMIPGKIPGTPAASGKGLQINPGGQTVYDPVTNVTWLANANLAATNSFGLPPCTSPTSPALCVDPDGAMTLASANQFIANMNSGAGYLGQTNWQLPPMETCTGYNCADSGNPLVELYSSQLASSPGVPVVATPDIAVGPFHNIQPYLYWSCEAAAIQDACLAAGPASGFEFSFSFGNGFLGTDLLANDLYVTAYFAGTRTAASGPEIAVVANAEGETPTIAPNTWVEIKGVNLAPAGDSRIWQGSDFVGGKLPEVLDGVSVTVNGMPAYVYYISPGQIDILTPPDGMSGSVPVQVTAGGAVSALFTAQAQTVAPAFFVFNGGPYVAATHADGNYLGPATLYPSATTPAAPGETVVLYANGFGATSSPVVSGAQTQSGTLSPLPVVSVGGVNATVKFAGLVAPGEFQFNVIVPAPLPNGDQSITATYNGVTTQPGTLITVQK
jgi:uncharacterized protein (TIGR03437 family)